MTKSRYFWSIMIVAVVLVGIGWIAISQEPVTAIEPGSGLTEAPIPGYLAPNFVLYTTLGEEVTMDDYLGRPVVLNFWATWCPPCRAEVPHFQEASVKYNGKATIVGIDQGEPSSVVTDFANSFALSYPLLLDQDNSVNRQYGVTALPTTVFVDAQGVVREVYTGIINGAVLQDRIENLLNEG
jgi:peroxiredoxin